jgi:hypothetical protein
MFQEGELMTRAAPLPLLSSTLRSRVLAAAGAARARRERARRCAAGALVMSGLLVLTSWIVALPLVPKNLAALESGLAEISFTASPLAAPSQLPATPYCRRERLIAAKSDDWRMVEAEFKSREEFTRRAQM